MCLFKMLHQHGMVSVLRHQRKIDQRETWRALHACRENGRELDVSELSSYWQSVYTEDFACGNAEKVMPLQDGMYAVEVHGDCH